MLQPEPVTLSGRLVRLEPLRPEHFPALIAAAAFPQLWGYTLWPMETPSDIERYLHAALGAQAVGSALPFAQVEVQSGEVIGSTRYMNIDVPNRKLEIGATWLRPERQRSGVNREAKLLLLSHAFEQLDVLRVEFKGDARNAQSRRALEGIGASFEGILRQHMRNADGSQRDSFYYSILQGEWPALKQALRDKLAP